MKLVSPGIAYRLLSFLLYPLWILHAFRHGWRHKVPNYLGMRMFGIAADATPRVWVHASSVGEVRAVIPLVQALIDRGEKILFTSFTASGFRAIDQHFADTVSRSVIPFDHCWHCRRYFQRQRIKLGLVMETELWPELLYQACNQQIELLQINARLSNKSLATSGMIRRLLTRTLGYFSVILTRNERDLADLEELGADPTRVQIVGNIKAHTGNEPPSKRLVERDYLILASSHAGEEYSFLAARPAQLNDRLVVIVPRHPHRSASIQAEIEQQGLRYAVRSKAQAIDHNTEVYIADTFGELKSLLAYAQIVVMGGSFNATGGHNLSEPASLGCAIITGPSDSNIAEDIAFLGNGSGVLQVADMGECWQAIVELLEHPTRAQTLRQTARQRLAQRPSVIQQYLSKIEPWL